MKLICAVLLLTCVGVCWGQEPLPSDCAKNRFGANEKCPAPLKCGKGFEWYADGLIVNADGTTGQCVKWKKPKSDGIRCYSCESGHCGGCIEHIPADKIVAIYGSPAGSWSLSEPAPLMCGKWEHFVPAHEASCNTSESLTSCIYHVDDVCAPDLHPVITEKEWQELMQMQREWREFRGRLDTIRQKLEAK